LGDAQERRVLAESVFGLDLACRPAANSAIWTFRESRPPTSSHDTCNQTHHWLPVF
jgi:hypothetical protein